jgi:hypothetical protein
MDLDFLALDKKNNLKHSASLQDLSAYNRVDPEEGYLTPIKERVSNHEKTHILHGENGGSTFSKEKVTLQGKPFERKKWIRVIMVLCCLVLLSFFLFALQYLYSNWSQKGSKFYVVLDCGSTGTRVYVYQASKNRRKEDNLPFLLKSLPESLKSKPSSKSGRAYNRMETEPGFDKLVHNKSGLKLAIKPLIQWAENQIPSHAHKSTSLFLYATAGVRRLPSSDSKRLLENAWSILKNSSSFLCEKSGVKIISGTEEAYFGWIALNYHTGMLGANPKKETFGALDLGGSSLQVTFENKDDVQNETSLDLNVGSVNHPLTAYSLSGYGLNDAFDKSVVHLLKNLPNINYTDLPKGKIVIEHPCLQSGYKEDYICSQCSGKDKTGILVQLIGVPKWEKCNELAKVTVNLSEWSSQSPSLDCDVQPCALSENLPRPHGQFYGMSGFYVVYKFFNLSSDAALDDVLEKGEEFCGKNWGLAKTSVAPQPFIEQYCFRAPYAVFLLREGLHIADSQVIIGSGSITWTLGVALLEAGKAFSSKVELSNYEIFQMKINPTILLSVLLFSLLLLLCALSCVANWTPSFLRRAYLPRFRQNNLPNYSVLRKQRWSPISSGETRVKMPLSPIASSQKRPFSMDNAFSNSGIQLSNSPLYSSSSSVAHSYSAGSLGLLQFDNNASMSAVRTTPHRNQMHLQSRRSQSREDLSASLADAYLP